MPIKQCLINRDASVLYRCSRSFYDRRLEKFGITSGLPFFLLRISENPGITLSELAERGRFDKATTQRALRKLMELGYICMESDTSDRRTRHIYLRESAGPVLDECYRMLEDWQKIITGGFSEEEIALVEKLMTKVADSAYGYLKKTRNEPRED